jgi:hypothetical protein
LLANGFGSETREDAREEDDELTTVVTIADAL